MSNNMNQFTNQVTVLGTISTVPSMSHNYDGMDYYSLRLKVPKRYYNFDIIHMFISEKDLVTRLDQMDIGTCLKVTGHLVQSELNEKMDISVLAETVEILPTIEGLDSQNQVILGGVVSKNYPLQELSNRKLKYFILKSVDEADENVVFSKINCWNYSAEKAEAEIQEGSRILVKGSLVSYKKTIKSKHQPDKELTYHEIDSYMIISLDDPDSPITTQKKSGTGKGKRGKKGKNNEQPTTTTEQVSDGSRSNETDPDKNQIEGQISMEDAPSDTGAGTGSAEEQPAAETPESSEKE